MTEYKFLMDTVFEDDAGRKVRVTVEHAGWTPEQLNTEALSKAGLRMVLDAYDKLNTPTAPPVPEKTIGSPTPVGKYQFPAKCCKCGKVDWRDAPVQGVYFCSYACT